MSAENIRTTYIIITMVITFAFYIFMAGKITQSINQNTIAIQQATTSIQKNTADIVNLQIEQRGSNVVITNVNALLQEIREDVKAIKENRYD